MKRIIYTITALSFLLVLTSAVNSFKNTTLVLPPTDKQLVLPDQLEDYEVTFPANVLDFMMGWGNVDTTFIMSITDEKATLGRVLFYDDRLSGDNSLSCGSCHEQALSFADDTPLSTGIQDQLTTRNSMTLNDLGWQLGSQFFWDFRSDGLETAVLQPILAAHELGKNMPDLIVKLEAAEEYIPLFQEAYGDSDITEDRIANSLALFIASMSSFDSKFDQGFNQGFNNFSSSELSGMQIFDNNCSFCHVSPHFGSVSPFEFFITGNNGLDAEFTDLGMGGWMTDPILEGLFKSPSLRNIEVSAPYMHDGRFATLEDVIDFYSEDVQFNENSAFRWMFGDDFSGYDFSDAEKEDLLSFLKTLTDYTLLTDEKWSDPWQAFTSIAPELLEGINVFPNPTADVVTVEINNQSGEIYNVSIYDITGKLINSFKTSDTVLEIPRGTTPAGLYELVASNGQQQKTFKLIYR